MRLVFFSVSRHQRVYYEKLKQNLDIDSEVVHYISPKSFLSILLGLFRYKKCNHTDKILSQKLLEIDRKYSSSIYKLLYKILLNIEVPLLLSIARDIIQCKKATHIVLWNGKKFHQELVCCMASKENVKCIFFENGVLPNTTTMDIKGVNATNSVPRISSFYELLDFDSSMELPTQLIPRVSKKPKILTKDTLVEQYIFVPFQVGHDTQIIRHSPWIEDMHALFSIICQLSDRLEINFIIKEHPSDNHNDYSILHQQCTPRVQFSSQNTQRLIDRASAIMTINSSVAMESLLFHKRVIILGEAFFAIDRIVKVATSYAELTNILESLDSWSVPERLVDNFLRYIYFDYLIAGDWRMPDQRHYHEIEQRLNNYQQGIHRQASSRNQDQPKYIAHIHGVRHDT